MGCTGCCTLKDQFHAMNESCTDCFMKMMVRLKLYHLKVVMIVLPCIFIPLLYMYSQEPQDMSYPNVDMRNADLYKNWLKYREELERRTITPLEKLSDDSDNEALFNHWIAHQNEESDLFPKRRTVKRIILDGVSPKVIFSEFIDKRSDANAKKDSGSINNIGRSVTPPINQNVVPKITTPKKNAVVTTQTPKTVGPKPYVTRAIRTTPAPMKVILLWNEVFVKQGYLQFKKCPVTNCFITSDKKQFNSSHAVIFNMGGQTGVKYRELKDLRKNPKQNWIFYQRESQIRPLTSDNIELFNGMFNLTMTFKKSSNIWQPYYHYKLRTEMKRVDKNFAEGKTKLVAWLLGNCNEDSITSKRIIYFRKLQTYIAADLFSNCPGGTPCNTECINAIYRNYKFIFAAESALCDDFATAITWKPLTLDIVPIVLGGSNYSSLLPPKSFIDVKDFSSVEALANHIRNVSQNDQLYNSYFQWRKAYDLGDSHVGFCKLCSYLNQESSNVIVQYNLEKFWDMKKDCVTAEQYYKGHL